nr:subtilisin-like protease SBT4.3 [Coffea arabica]
MVEGKIVIREQKTEGDVVAEAGAFGTIMLVSNLDDFSSLYPLPVSLVNLETNGSSGISRNPTATILRRKELSNTQAPYNSSFSSWGPNKINPQILKPDLAAPGVDILAAWPPTIPPSKVPGDKRIVAFNFLSGTSMACPHATGAAAYVKTFHPPWSPAAIKSALMTTANPNIQWVLMTAIIKMD